MYSKLLFLCITVTLLFSGSASIPLQKRVAGVATFYDVGLGACGETNTADQLIAAAGASRFDSSKPGICGQQVTVTGPKGSVTVAILDRCVGCGENDFDLSRGAFQQIADFTQGRVAITWNFVGGGGGGGGSDDTPAPKAAPKAPQAAPPAPPETTTSTTSSTTSITPTTTTSSTTSITSTTTTSTTTTPTPTTPPVNNVAAAFFMGTVFNDLANNNYTVANSTTTTQP